MSGSQNRYQARPYGAIEMKMTYQRNMLMANATVLLFTAALFVTGSVLIGEVAPPVGPPPDDPRPDSIIAAWDDGNNLLIIPEGGLPRPHTPTDRQGWNLVPVEDDLIVEDRPVIDDGGFGVSEGPSEPGEHEFGYSPPRGSGPVDDFPEYGIFVPVEKEPAMIVETKPDYPSVARRIGLEGKVTIGALVGVDGTVRDVRVVKSSGSDALDEAALAAAYRNIYTPGIQNGTPIPVWVTYVVLFRLD